jgi:hypothetical protein
LHARGNLPGEHTDVEMEALESGQDCGGDLRPGRGVQVRLRTTYRDERPHRVDRSRVLRSLIVFYYRDLFLASRLRVLIYDLYLLVAV